MRYLLHKSQLNEMSARKDYLYDIFHLYFLPRHLEGDYQVDNECVVWCKKLLNKEIDMEQYIALLKKKSGVIAQ